MTKRHSAPDPAILEVNGVRLNLGTRQVLCDGIPVDITPLEFDILELLVRAAGRVVSTAELIRSLESKPTNSFEGNLDVQVNQLKFKLERGRRLIRRMQGAGYLFATADEHGASNHQLA